MNDEKLRADGLQRDLADAYQIVADQDRELDTIKELFRETADGVCPVWHARPTVPRPEANHAHVRESQAGNLDRCRIG